MKIFMAEPLSRLKIRALIILLMLIATCIFAQQAHSCEATLFHDTKIVPSREVPGSPPAIQAGFYKGEWGGATCHVLLVEEVMSGNQVRVTYYVQSADKLWSLSYRTVVPVINTNTITLRLNTAYPREMKAEVTYVFEGDKARAYFASRDPRSLGWTTDALLTLSEQKNPLRSIPKPTVRDEFNDDVLKIGVYVGMLNHITPVAIVVEHVSEGGVIEGKYIRGRYNPKSATRNLNFTCEFRNSDECEFESLWPDGRTPIVIRLTKSTNYLSYISVRSKGTTNQPPAYSPLSAAID